LEEKSMNKKSWMRWLHSISDNLKSKIKNLKWAGLFTVVMVFVGLADVVQAQQPTKLDRIGLLTGGHGLGSAGEEFRVGLRKLGWIEGRNLAIESRMAEVDFEKLPRLAAELVRIKVAVIVADGDPAIHAAKQATSTIAIVGIAAGDLVREHLVASLARPGGNLTGLTSISVDLGGKRLELIHEAFPKARRVAVIWNPDNPSNALEYEEMERAAHALGLKLQALKVRAQDDFRGAFAAAVKERANALVVVRDTLIDSHHFQIMDFAIDKRLPCIYGEMQFVEAGGLMSYGPSRLDLFRRAAVYVDKILKGRTPADLPVEQPMKFEFVVNLKAAKQIGVTIPPNVLVRADKVIR
jgi:putative ABC transport system substrate-binding protein